jgi:penicillin amidase
MPVAGWTSAHDWTGYVPFDQLPSELNPAKGFIVTANNAIVGSAYPVWLTSDWDYGYRANEITARLAAEISDGTKLTAADMSRLQGDNLDQNADVLVPMLTALKLTGDAKRGVDLLRGWDHRDDADSAAAAYFNIFFKNLLQYAFARKMPDAAPPTGGDRWFQVVARLAAEPDSPWWSDGDLGLSGRDDMFGYVAKKAYQEATQLMGGNPSDWRWGDIHTLELTNASLGTSGIGVIEALFNRGPYEVSGSSSVVNATSWNASEGYTVTTLPSMRQVVDLSDFDKSTWINLTGESGHAFNPNYVDQTPLWQEHRTRLWPFTPAAVRAAAKDTLTLTQP